VSIEGRRERVWAPVKKKYFLAPQQWRTS